MEPLSLLAQSFLFQGIPSDRLQQLLPALRRRSFPRGARLFQEGDPASQLYIIVSGQVQISRTRSNGDEVIHAVLTEADCFGELALLEEGAVRSADATALAPTSCLTLDRGALNTFLDADPEMLRRIPSALIAYIRRKDEAFADVALLDVPGRVARQLLDLAERRGTATDGGLLITVRLSQRTLAGMVGASRENVNRALVNFAVTGAIRQERGHIVILKPSELRRRAFF